MEQLLLSVQKDYEHVANLQHSAGTGSMGGRIINIYNFNKISAAVLKGLLPKGVRVAKSVEHWFVD